MSIVNFPSYGVSDADIDGTALMVSQWRDLHTPASSPLQKLYMAVLVDALACLAGRAKMESGGDMVMHRRRAAWEAREWFKAESSAPFAFETVAMALSLDPDWLRGRVLSGRMNDITSQSVRRRPAGAIPQARVTEGIFTGQMRGARVR